MLPSSLLGAVLFLFLLAPGLAFVLRRERAVPEAQRSAFRETVQVVAASAISLFVTGLLLTAARAVWPDHTLNVRGQIRAPKAFFLDHHVQVAWWAVASLSAATLLAWVAADPRLPRSRIAMWLTRSKVVRAVSGPSAPIKRSSAWYVVAHLFDGDEQGLIQVGAQLDDGTYVVGYLDHYNIDTGESPDRDMLLHGPLGLVTADGKKHNLEATYTVISARRVVRIDFTHLAPSAKPTPVFAPEPAEQPKKRWTPLRQGARR